VAAQYTEIGDNSTIVVKRTPFTPAERAFVSGLSALPARI
jgi:hypothetical protein